VRVLDRSGYRHQVGRSFGGGKVAAGRLATTFRRRALSERNKTFVMALTFPAPIFQIVFPLHLLLLLLEGTLLSLVKRDWLSWKDLWAGVWSLGAGVAAVMAIAAGDSAKPAVERMAFLVGVSVDTV